MGIYKSSPHVYFTSAQTYHFGTVDIYHEENNPTNKYFKQTYNFIIEPNTEQPFIQKLKKHNNSCSQIVQIKHIEINDTNTCSAAKNITIHFQYLPTTLENIIERSKQNFSQHQVWKVYMCLLKAVKFLNDKQSYHGDICPNFIYYDTRTLRYKLFDSSFFSPLKSGYYRAQTQKAYSSPQVLANIHQKRTFPLYNHFVSDSFSIGLVVLYCMTKIDPKTAYDYQEHEIDFYYIDSMIRIAKKNEYSDHLIEQIQKCLRKKNRPQVSDLLKDLKNIQSNGDFSALHHNKMSLKK